MLVFTWDATPERVAAALKAGAAGVVSKTLSAEQLVDAVQRVHAGEIVTPDADTSTGKVLGRWPGDECGVTARESEVLALICQGLSNQAVSESMYLSVNTVKSYVRSLYRTINVTTRSQAVVWGMSNGFQPQTVRCHPKTTATADGARPRP